MSSDFYRDLFENIIPTLTYHTREGINEISIQQMVSTDDMTKFLELLSLKWPIITRDIYGPTLIADVYRRANTRILSTKTYKGFGTSI